MTPTPGLDFAVSKLHRRAFAVGLWALGRKGEVQRRGLRVVIRDLCQTPGICVIDMERMKARLGVLYCSGGTRSQWTAVYRSVTRALEL